MNVETIAYHEAGHAVMAVMLGGQVVSVSVGGESEETEGSVAVLWRGSEADPKRAMLDQIRVALAGPVAEMVYEGDYDYLRIRSEHEMDWRIALTRLEKLGLTPEAQSKLLHRTVSELYHTVRQDNVWSAIGDVADRLAVDEIIEGDTVAEMVNFWMNRQ